MIWFWNHYLRSEADKRDPRAVPLLGRFENLPPLFVSGAEFDPLAGRQPPNWSSC